MTVFVLKWIAIVTMLIDHVGYIFMSGFSSYLIFRSIGRLAFPIFAFFIAEGCYMTKNVHKYLLRLFAFVLISELPFDFAFHGTWVYIGYQNIFFTLLLGVLSIYLYNRLLDKGEINKYFALVPPVIMAAVAEFLHTDYGGIGVLIIFFLYYFRESFSMRALVLLSGNIILAILSGPIQLLGALTIIPLYFYNGRKGMDIKYFFYAFYPAHLLILAIIYSWKI